MGTTPSGSNKRLATGLAAVITLAWGVSFVVDIVAKNYDPPPSVHALMMMAAGAVFGEGLLNVRNEESSKSKKKESDDDA